MTAKEKARLVLLSVVALVLFNFPMIEIVDQHTATSGIPVLYLYFFAVWVIIILGNLYLTKSKDP